MKPIKTYPVHLVLPLAILLIFSGMILLYSWQTYQQHTQRIITRATHQIQEYAWQLASHIKYALHNQDQVEIQHALAEFSLTRNSNIAVLLSKDNQVFLSPRYSWTGKNITELVPDLAPLLPQAWSHRDVFIVRKQDRITAFIPIYGQQSQSLRPQKQYLLILGLDLRQDLNSALADIRHDTLPFIGMSIVFALLLFYLLRYFLTRPLLAIHTLTQQFKTGNVLSNPLTGHTLFYDIAQTLVDSSHQIQAQINALSEREQRLNVTLQSIGDAVIVTDETGVITRMNPKACLLTGWSEDSAIGQPILDIFDIYHATTNEPVVNPVEQVLKTGEVVELANHTVLLARNGQRYHISDSAAPIRDPQHDPDTILGVILVFQDVTPQYSLRQQLREKVDFLEKLIQLMPGVIYTLHINHRQPLMLPVTFISPSIENYTGVSDTDWLKHPKEWIKRIHPDDRDAVKATLERVCQTHDTVSNQFRIRHAKGHYITVRDQLTAVYDAEHHVTEIIGIAQDISDEQQLIHQQKLFSEILEHSLNEILIFDAHTLQFIFANKGAQHNLGYTLAELTQCRVTDIRPETTPEQYQQLLAPLLRGDMQRLEINTTHQRKNGSLYPVLLSLQLFDYQNQQVVIAIAMDMTLQKASSDRIEFLAHHDPLTQLPNRILLNDRIHQALKLAERHNQSTALLYLDLDRFKNINDSLGHDIGDALLIEIAKILVSQIREEDTVSRTGGDEFTILLVNTDANGAAHVAQKLIDAVSRPFEIKGNYLFVSFSIGICMAPDNGTTPQELSKNADTAMYRAKTNGRNQYLFFTQNMYDEIVEKIRLETALRSAITNQELSLFYQPQIEISTQRLIGCEALLRWQPHPGQFVSPALFIPIAEESGQIEKIGHWVLETAIRQTRQWLDAGITHHTTAINLSAAQFMNPALVANITQILNKYAVPAHCIELEITESTLIDNIDLAMQQMKSLADQGFQLALDDFGTGYSSLSYLKRFPINKLKIDQSFIFDMLNDPEDEAIVDAIITLARTLKLNTIAEGVETQAHLDKLKQKGCYEVQGYYFSRPIPAADYTRLLHHPDTLFTHNANTN